MARLKKRVINSKSRRQQAQQQASNDQLKNKMKELMAQEQYADAMDVMAEIAKSGHMDGETMYMGALCYFKTDDCDRAAIWIGHALERDAGNYQAQLLLSRICLEEDRIHDGLQVLENVLAAAGDKLSQEEEEELVDDLYYFKYAAQEELAQFPRIQRLLGIEVETAAEAAPHQVEQQELDTQNIQLEQENQVPGEDQAADRSFDAGEIVEQIQAKNVSVADKVRLLNNFAAGCYQAEDYANAYTLLAEALRLDCGNEAVLRNMAYTCAALGQSDKALAFASQMPMVDFGCLQAAKRASC